MNVEEKNFGFMWFANGPNFGPILGFLNEAKNRIKNHMFICMVRLWSYYSLMVILFAKTVYSVKFPFLIFNLGFVIPLAAT